MDLQRSEMVTCCKGSVLEAITEVKGCELTCCGEAMTKIEPKTADAATEKHVPIVEKVDGGVKVKVGSVPHPMEEDHWIQMIEIQTATREYKAFLKPGDAPEAVFKIDEPVVAAREYCNKHGLWKETC